MEQLYRWVKASERLPESGREVYIRGYERLPIGIIYAKWSDPQNCYFICIGTPRHTYTEFREGHESLRLIEWLEPIEESEQDELWNRLVKYLNDYNDENESGKMYFPLLNLKTEFYLIKK